MNELSPRRFPRSPVVPPKTPPQWKKPEEVMIKRKIRLKENALMARIEGAAQTSPTSGKRRNPFLSSTWSEPQHKKVIGELESNGEASLREILGFSESSITACSAYNFPQCVNISSKGVEDCEPDLCEPDLLRSLPLDWTLRTKMRFISPKPFPWSQTLRTCEEASGVTGFVRCVDSYGEGGKGLDSSTNARFHQNCLLWQHPSLPWIELFPRHAIRRAEKTPTVAAIPIIRESLYKDWSNSFRSLFQLVRARHCPYFYMVANRFTCLFRSAGINGGTEISASICPTTRGFRKLLADEGINFSLPLQKDDKKRKKSVVDDEDDLEGEDDEEVDDERNETKEWLTSLGIPEAEIGRISAIQEAAIVKAEGEKDGIDESLVRVDGCEAQALFNFLINCKSITTTTGPLTGVPPTLLAPVAFTGATLLSLKVRENTVKLDNERFHTLEVRGPILPNIVHNLCTMLQDQLHTFSVTLANVESTKAFTCVKDGVEVNKPGSPSKPTQAFSLEGLADSGFESNLLSIFCSNNLQIFDSIKYSEGSYLIS